MNYKGTLTIGVSKDGDCILIKISDTGCGIPESNKERIFEPFFTTKNLGESTGLGLDIVKKIVKKHNGDIGFDSQPGSTTFWVRLPIDSSSV